MLLGYKRLRRLAAYGCVVLTATALAATGTAFGAAQTFGSPLAPGTTGLFGCETRPVIESATFNYVPAPSGLADCTWRQSGVFGVTDDPRFSSVPGDGIITQIEVLSGANPAPLRIAILRQLGTGGFAGQCCFFVSETAPLQPAPNTVTTFPVAIPVQRNTIDGVQAIDLLGVSAQSGAGSLPIRQVGSTSSFALTSFGSVNAGIFYPRIGADPNDNGGGRREEGVPGFELTLRATWCGTKDTSCQPAGAADAALAAQIAKVRAGRALVRMICNGNAACEGRLALVNPGALSSSAGAARTTTYGSAKYKLSAGGTATIKVKLNRKGKSLLRKRKKARVGIRVTPTSGSGSNGFLTLKR